MKMKLLYALLATSVAASTSVTASALVLTWIPKGRPRDMAERLAIAPGQMLFERLQERKAVRRLRKAGKARIKEGRERVEEAAEEIVDRLGETEAGEALAERLSGELERLPHLYNIGLWTTTGFFLSLFMTFVFGVSSLRSALALGFKVTMTLAFLQLALVLGGLLLFRKLA